MGSIVTQQVVNYCAQECAWQYSGELSVGWMVEAWRHAHRFRNQPIKLRDVLALGRLIEPEVNTNGLRTYNVEVFGELKMDCRLVPEALNRLLECQPALPAPEDDCVKWFKQYEDIHPFRDGNGRSGTLLFNWLRGSLKEPIHAPNLWSDPRRGAAHPQAVALPLLQQIYLSKLLDNKQESHLSF